MDAYRILRGTLLAAGTLTGVAAQPTGSTQPAASSLRIGPVAVQGSFRTRFEAWNWFGEGAYGFSGNLLRLSFARAGDGLDWQIELAAPVLLGLPDNAVASGAQGQLGLGAAYYAANHNRRVAGMIFPKQAFVRFKWGGAGSGHALRAGRFEFVDGSEMIPKDSTVAALKRDRIHQRLLGSFAWTHVGRSFDGVHYSYARRASNFTFVGAIPTRGVFQTDGWGETSTAIGYAAYTKAWGKGTHSAETRWLGIYYQDWRSVLKTDSRPLALRRADNSTLRIATFGGHHLSAINTPAGAVDVLAWGVVQTGRWGTLDHRAHAADAEAGVQPRILPGLKPWIRFGVFQSSGDANAADGRHETFFQLLPTPRAYARFPFFNLMNNRDYFVALVLRPHRDVTISSEAHALRLSAVNDLWYAGGGVFQPWTFGYAGRPPGGARSLANLYDVAAEYRVRPNITATAYLGYSAGRAVVASIYPTGKNGALGYLELAYRF